VGDSIEQRERVMRDLHDKLARDQLTMGQAIRQLRLQGTGLKQEQFAKTCRISVRSLISIEQDEGNPTVKSLNQILRLFGLKVGIVGLKPLDPSPLSLSPSGARSS
jgi:transcriptional regulator with XRE-family HTH domain